MCSLSCIKLYRLLKNVFIIGLLLVFIISTSGITVFSHYCSGSKKTTHQILHELSGSKHGCGGMSCNITRNNLVSLIRQSIGKTPCCKENSSFYKVATVNDPPLRQHVITLPVVDLLISGPNLLPLLSSDICDLTYRPVRCIPPPLSGRQLVVFLQQMRISAPTCFS
jgi:hypothetical protein